MEPCPSLCSVPIMHGTRADITFRNEIYGFGGSALSSVAQNNIWSFRSDDSTWRNIIPSSPQNHPRTSWPQMVRRIDPVTGKWDGDTLISVVSNDASRLSDAGVLTVMLFSASRREWASISNSQVIFVFRIWGFNDAKTLFFHLRFSILLRLVVAIYLLPITGLCIQAKLLFMAATTGTLFSIRLLF
jgi:hypothetical protein